MSGLEDAVVRGGQGGARPDRALYHARQRARLAPTRPWPPAVEEVRALLAEGIGDKRAARLFGVHRTTYRGLRRALGLTIGGTPRPAAPCLAAPCPAAPCPAAPAAAPSDGHGRGPVDPRDYGFDPRARWPAGCRFTDDPRAVSADRLGRVAPPETRLERSSAIAGLAE